MTCGESGRRHDRGDRPGELDGGFAGPELGCPHCCGAGPELGCPHCCGAGAAGFRAPEADLGDVVVTLLVGTLAGLRDRLYADGFETAASVIQDLVEVADDYVSRLAP